MSFSFEFSGDDIEAATTNDGSISHVQQQQAQPAGKASAFPVQGKPQLPPIKHDLKTMLSNVPSRIAYSMLDIVLDSGETMQLPRRELWDVRVQLMTEEEDGTARIAEGLGDRDVKTGVYEGGFKSWESSVDLVKVLATQSHPISYSNSSARVIELGCGTGLPSLAMFQWTMSLQSSPSSQQYSFVLADYNPSVLQLVTLPNFILTWALYHRQSLTELQDAFSQEDELELSPSILDGFETYLHTHSTALLFLSGGWSAEFVQLLYSTPSHPAAPLPAELSPVSILLGAETIYSPFALQAFTETVLALLLQEKVIFGSEASAWVAAKKLYFGVGGSLDDFVDNIRKGGTIVTRIRDEVDGVRRGVVRCTLAPVE